ncbi:MAG: SPOR domain-containing protein [Bacteroidota bacterium]
MRIGKYISDLLYEHEVVILPGFGTFSTRYIPAKFIPEKQVVEAPVKVADFSNRPDQGDTPLTKYIAENEGMTEDEVLAMYENLTNDIKRSLNAGKKVAFEGVGTFHLDADNNLQFEPDRDINYLEEATGVDKVTTPWLTYPMTPKDSNRPEETVGSSGEPDKTPPPPQEPEQTTATENRTPTTATEDKTQTTEPMKEEDKKTATLPPALRWLAYVLIPLLVIIIIVLLNYSYFFDKDDGLFRSSGESHVEMTTDDPTETEIRETPLEEDRIDDPEEPVDVEPDIETTLTDPDATTYYLLVGSFRSETRAQELAEELRRQGADMAEVMTKTPSDYYRVSYGYYHDFSKAQSQMEELPEELKDVAWILHR